MAEIENKNPPLAKENSKETLHRLQKLENKADMVSKILKNVVGYGIAAVGGLVGFTFGSVPGAAFGAVLGAMASVPLATTLMAVPVAIENIAKYKIQQLRKKFPRSMDDVINSQNWKTISAEKEYEKALASQDSTQGYIASKKEEVDKQKKREEIFVKAAALAKQENKEKTIGRLMDLADKYPIKNHRLKYAGIQGAYALIAPASIAKLSGGFPTLAAVAGGISVAATAYCAIQAYKDNKEEKAGEKAFKVLENYTRDR